MRIRPRLRPGPCALKSGACYIMWCRRVRRIIPPDFAPKRVAAPRSARRCSPLHVDGATVLGGMVTHQQLESAKGAVELSGGLLYLHWASGAFVVEDDARAVMAKASALCSDRPRPMLVAMNRMEGVEHKARNVFCPSLAVNPHSRSGRLCRGPGHRGLLCGQTLSGLPHEIFSSSPHRTSGRSAEISS